MSTITVRNLDPAVKDVLRMRAARNGRSMEAEIRAILAEALAPATDLRTAIRRRLVSAGAESAWDLDTRSADFAALCRAEAAAIAADDPAGDEILRDTEVVTEWPDS